MGMHPGVVAGLILVGIVLLLLVILLPMSFQRVAFDEAGITYNTLTRTLDPTVVTEGLHNVGPSGEIIIFKTTQRTANVDVRAITKDGMTVGLSVQVAYTINNNEIYNVIQEFTDQKQHDEYLFIMCQSIVRDTAVSFDARHFYLQREDFQNQLLTDVIASFSSNNVYATVQIVQVVDITLPSSVESALQDTTVAQQDVQNAFTERAQSVQAAEIALNLTKQQADLIILTADREVDKINQESNQAVLAERNRILKRTFAFGNISIGLDQGGDFFVSTYLKSLVLQSNSKGKTIIGLE